MTHDEITERLREAAINPRTAHEVLTYWFTPEQVARGLERMRTAHSCAEHKRPDQAITWADVCPTCWAAMVDAFLEGVRDG